MAAPTKSTPRVREHCDKLREAGLDTQKFFDALIGLRDDPALPKAHREALYKLVAMESFIWYMEALRDEQIDRIKLRDEVNKLGAEYAAAIRSEKPGEKAAQLADKDIGVDAKAPPRATPPGPRKKGPPRAKAKGPPRKKGGPRPAGPRGQRRPPARPTKK